MMQIRTIYIATGLIWLVYIYIIFTSSPLESAKHLSIYVVIALRASIAILYLLIWIAGVFAWSHIKQYAEIVASSREGPALSAIANGLFVLVVGLVMTSFVGAIRSYFDNSPEIVLLATIVLNYLLVLTALIGCWFLHVGARLLYNQVEHRWLTTRNYVVGLLPVVFLSITYVLFIFTNPHRQMPVAYNIPASFYLSDMLIVFTFVIPTIIGWVFAVLSVMHLVVYVKNVKEHMYKEVFGKFMYGIASLIVGSIVVQVLISLGGSRFSGMSIIFIILLLYAFIVLQLIGYGLIALGAKELHEIKKAR